MVAALIALPFAPRAEQALQPGGFTSPDSESQKAIDVLTQKLNLSQTVLQVIFTSKRYTADDPQFIAESQQALAHLQGWSQVAQVESFTANPRQVSTDRHAAYVNIEMRGDPNDAPKLLPAINQRIQKVPDLQTYVGGSPVFYADIQTVSENDLRRAEILGFPFAIIALLFVFRSLIASILPAFIPS
jgi:putative drug exporter of the RND superfamily